MKSTANHVSVRRHVNLAAHAILVILANRVHHHATAILASRVIHVNRREDRSRDIKEFLYLKTHAVERLRVFYFLSELLFLRIEKGLFFFIKMCL